MDRGAEEKEAGDSSSHWQKLSERRKERPCSAGLCLWRPDPEIHKKSSLDAQRDEAFGTKPGLKETSELSEYHI